MADNMNAAGNKKTKYNFVELSADEKKKLLDGKDKKSTQCATNAAVSQFTHYLCLKKFLLMN